MVDLLREAAIDPNVTDIKMTFYRVAKNSNVANALINAVKNGKSVTVVIELQARFDEMANIYWTQKLEEAWA
jgi:polyphosphate kinase